MTLRFVVVLGAAALASSARAAEVRGTFSALISGREVPRGTSKVGTGGEAIVDTVADYPMYGLAALQVDGLAIPGIEDARLVLQGWGRLQLGDEAAFRDNSADLSVLFLEARRGPIKLRAGRQLLVEGVDRMTLIDGVEVGLDTPVGLQASAFTGTVVRRELELDRGDWVAGGRLAYRAGTPGEVGVAYSQRRIGGSVAHEEVGLDGFYQLGSSRLVGLAAVAPEARRLIEARLALSHGLRPDLTLTLDVERTAPDLFIPRTSIFSVFAEASHDALGGDVSWDPSPYYNVTAQGHWLRLDDASLGYRASVRAVTYREPSHRSLAGVELRRVDESDSGYARARLFTALQVLPFLRLAADAFAYRYDEPVNAEDVSYLGQLSLVYDVAPALRIVATVAGGVTPFVESQLEGFLRLAYGFETDLAREWTP